MSATREVPISWHVARWGDDPFSRGSWSYLRPGGSPADRWLLAEPIDDRFVLCGEAVGNSQPAMTHGAHESGVTAAKWCASVAQSGERVVVVGAGIAGVGAARTLTEMGIDCVVIEARPRVGGRVHTVDLPGAVGQASVAVDAGAAWLQQYSRNPFAMLARSLGAEVVPTDFHSPLVASGDGPVGDVAAVLAQLAAAASAATIHDDAPLSDVLATWSGTADAASLRTMRFAVDADVVLETGAGLSDTSARWFFAEDGVGNDDHWILGGYRIILDHLAAGLDIRLDSPVSAIEWGNDGVNVLMGHETLYADRCICSLPISLLQLGEPTLRPGLSPAHREALERVGMGVVDKVILRFSERWWPRPPHGYFRWYDTPASWCEWVDLTDRCGAPVVAGLIAHDAVTRHHHDRTDADVVFDAASVLQRWAVAVNQGC